MPLTLPNGLSLARLLVSPALIPVAIGGYHDLFWVVLVAALASDTLDGRVARATGQSSELGARLDSVADCALYCSAPIAALLLYPALWQEHGAAVVAVFIGYLGPITVGWLKFRRLTSYHTLAARAVSVLLPAGFILYVRGVTGWLLDAAAVALLLSAVEEIWLTVVLSCWTPNVPSIWHLLRAAATPSLHPSDDGTLA